MKVTYSPSNEDVQVFSFVPGKVRNSRASMIERLYSKEYGERQTFEMFKIAVQQGSAPARRVLLWHLQSMVHPTLRVEDVDFDEGELVVEFTRSELTDMRVLLEKVRMPDEGQRDLMLAGLDAQMDDAPEDDLGKAPSTSGSETTSSPSPTTSPDSADPTSSES